MYELKPDGAPPDDGNEMQRWHMRPYRPGDEVGLLDLYQRAFGRTRSIEQLRWKLLDRAQDDDALVWVAAESGSERIVGHYGGIPLEMKVGERVLPSIHSVEAMADPSFRKQGILTALGSQAHIEWTRKGYAAVIGLPNDKWGTRNTALGYVPLFPLVWLKFPLRLDRLIQRRLTRVVGPAAFMLRAASRAWRLSHSWQMGSASELNVVPLNLQHDASNIEMLWSKLGSAHGNLVVRSTRWMGWRYGTEPSQDYRILLCKDGSEPTGFLTFRLMRSHRHNTGYIADLFVAPGDYAAARSLLAVAFDQMEMLGAGSVMAAAVPGSVLYSVLRKCGFMITRHGFTFEVVPLDPAIDLRAIAVPADWHLSSGDFDIV